MGHGGESVVCSPQSHHTGNHHPHVGGPNTKKPNSLTKVNITNSGGISHNHENSKGSSSKVTKKSHAHSSNPQQPHQQTKAINVGKARQGQGSPNGNKANSVTLQHFHQQHFQSLAGRQRNSGTPRQKSFSPPTLHPMPSSGKTNSRTGSPVLPGSKTTKEHFYAGARFETHPSHVGLPVPPSHWIAPLQRSQSQPSSPVPTAVPQKGMSVDLATLFGYSTSTDSTFKSASFPGERMMSALVKTEDERKKKKSDEDNNDSIQGKLIGSPAKAQVNNGFAEKKSIDKTDELKKALGLAFTSPVKVVTPFGKGGISSNGSDMSTSKYQDISDQLKTLLKVAA